MAGRVCTAGNQSRDVEKEFVASLHCELVNFKKNKEREAERQEEREREVVCKCFFFLWMKKRKEERNNTKQKTFICLDFFQRDMAAK